MARSRLFVFVSLWLFLAMALIACRSDPAAGLTADSLHDLVTIDELRETFNADNGKPRLLLILAPT